MLCAALKNCVSINSFCILGMLICIQSHQSVKSVGSRPGPTESRSGLIEADLGPNCLQRLSADYKSVYVLGCSAGDDLLLIVTPIVGFCNSSMFCCTLLYVHSSFAALLSLPSCCLVIVV